MKNYLVVIVLLLAAFSNGERQPEGKEYVKIENIDLNSVKYFAPLVISKRKLNIKLNGGDSDEFKAWQKIDPNVKLEKFVDTYYRRVITDENTYSLLVSFIKNNPEFYSNSTDKINPAGFKEVTANGEIHDLFYKTDSGFFKELVTTLKFNNCDKKVIHALENMYR